MPSMEELLEKWRKRHKARSVTKPQLTDAEKAYKRVLEANGYKYKKAVSLRLLRKRSKPSVKKRPYLMEDWEIGLCMIGFIVGMSQSEVGRILNRNHSSVSLRYKQWRKVPKVAGVLAA